MLQRPPSALSSPAGTEINMLKAPLFSDSLLADLGRMPGAGYSFLKQLTSAAAAPLRELIERAVAVGGPTVNERLTELLTSLDNKHFFQGFGEAVTAHTLSQRGWKVGSLRWPGPSLVSQHADAGEVDVIVLTFIRQARPIPDEEVIDRLRRALNRVSSRSRIAVLVRRWLPHDFDPEPVRRAIEMWLREVDRGGWDGRYAAYDDENISLEFALTGGVATEGKGVVAFTLGPFDAQRTLEALERRIVFELDNHRMRHGPDRHVLLSCVTDQPWRVSRGYLREMLYGKPVRQSTSSDRPGIEVTYGPEYSSSLFRDPLYRNVTGLLMIDRPPAEPTTLRPVAWVNPWVRRPLQRHLFMGSTMAMERWERDEPVMRWERG